jgi:4-alpha-glucanotransferase
VVTEELGTAPQGGKCAFRERGFLDYAPVIGDDFDTRSADGVVSASTHDLPTVAGCWTGSDSRLLAAAGISLDREFAARSRKRLQEYAGADYGADTQLIINQLYGSLATSRSTVVVVSMEDALAVCERPNVPGTLSAQWPNFSQGLPLLPTVLDSPGISRLVTTMRASR